MIRFPSPRLTQTRKKTPATAAIVPPADRSAATAIPSPARPMRAPDRGAAIV